MTIRSGKRRKGNFVTKAVNVYCKNVKTGACCYFSTKFVGKQKQNYCAWLDTKIGGGFAVGVRSNVSHLDRKASVND